MASSSNKSSSAKKNQGKTRTTGKGAWHGSKSRSPGRAGKRGGSASARNRSANRPVKDRSVKDRPVKDRPVKRRPLKRLLWRFILLALLLLTAWFVVYLYHLDKLVSARFEGRVWQLPSHVYARPLEIYLGKPLRHEQLQYELDYLNYEKVTHAPKRPAQYSMSGDSYEVKTRDFSFWDGMEQSVTARISIENNRVVKLENITTDSGSDRPENRPESRPEYRPESRLDLLRFDAGYLTGIFPAHAEDRILVKLEQVPDTFIMMLLLVEDRRYFEHIGVDPKSIVRALMANLSSGRTVQGGSTLTQQLVKNLFLTQERTLKRKVNEALMSVLLEFRYNKRLILETYLNEVYLGQDGRRSIHGIGLASKFYFDKPVNELSIDEMAVLVGMIKGASYYNPRRQPEHARERRNVVLSLMREQQLLTEAETTELQQRPVRTVKHASAGKYPAFIDMVKHQLREDYNAEDLRSEGMRVFTTLDPYAQHVAESAVIKGMPKLDGSGELQVAAIVLSPESGELLAVVGDRNPSFRGFNRVLNAHRPVGSLMKPLVYLSALENGNTYSLASMIDDSELVYRDETGKTWRPQNYDRTFHGNVTMYEAILMSYNIPVVRTALDTGLKQVRETAIAMGANQSVSTYPSMALGASPMTPLEVATIYQGFAANGFSSPVRSVRAVLDSDDTPLERYPVDVSTGVSAENVAVINSAMIDVTRYGTARRLQANMPVTVAGKTGTSDDLRDSWFAGFSGDAVSVVWLGYDDNRPTSLTGASGAMKIWQAIMKQLANQPYQLLQSHRLERHWIDPEDGLMSRQDCKNAVELVFVAGTQPAAPSNNLRDCNGETSNWFFNLFQ